MENSMYVFWCWWPAGSCRLAEGSASVPPNRHPCSLAHGQSRYASPLRFTNNSNYIHQPNPRQPFFASTCRETSESSPNYRIQPATFPLRLLRACCRQVAVLCLLVADKCLHQTESSLDLLECRASLLTHPALRSSHWCCAPWNAAFLRAW